MAGPSAATNFLSPEDYARLLQQAEAENRAGLEMNQAPRHWTQALAGALNQGLSGYREGQARERYGATKAAGAQAMAALLRGDEGAFDAAMKIPGFENQAMQYELGRPQREAAAFNLAQDKANAPLQRQIMEAKLKAANAPESPKLQKVGVDAYGRPQFGYVNADRSVSLVQLPNAGGSAPTTDGIPPGLDPELQDILKAAPPRKRALFNQMWKTGKPDKAIAMLQEQPLAGEAAARVGLLRQAGKVIPRLRKLWIEDAKDRGSVAEGANYLLGRGDVGEARRLSSGAMEGILRAATGAAVTSSEEARYSRMFVPDPTDTIETRERKLNALQRFISDIELALNQGRQLTQVELDDLSSKATGGLAEGGQPAAPQGAVGDDVKKRADEILRKRGIIQ